MKGEKEKILIQKNFTKSLSFDKFWESNHPFDGTNCIVSHNRKFWSFDDRSS